MGFVQMKKFLLTSVMAFAFAAPAYAANPKCSTVPVAGFNLTQSQCESDNQVNDADDLKFFVDKQSGLNNILGSLDKNTSIPGDENIKVTINGGATATITQDGNGFAELKSSLKGSPLNDLRAFTFTSIVGSIIDGQGVVFNGFDGFFGRGQVDATGPVVHGKNTWDGDVFENIVFADNTTLGLSFLGDTKNDDIGAVGFDEPNDPGKLIKSVTFGLDNTGAWNEAKQFEFSVPGAVATPEPSTWVMGIIGFGLMAAMGWKRSRNSRHAIA